MSALQKPKTKKKLAKDETFIEKSL